MMETMDYHYLLPEGRGPWQEEPVPPPKPRVWGGWATFGFGFVIIIVTAVVQGIIGVIIGVGLVVTQTIDIDDLSNLLEYFQEYLGLIVAISTIANGIIGTALILLIIKTRRGLGFREYLGFNRFSGRWLLLAILILVIFLGLSYVVETYTGYGEPGEDTLDLFATDLWPALVWFAVCVAAPFYEEIWIRGFMQIGFVHSRVGLIGALIIPSAFWAAQHIQYQIFGIGVIFVFGLVLGFVRHKSGSIWPPIIMHAINNAVALALMTMV